MRPSTAATSSSREVVPGWKASCGCRVLRRCRWGTRRVRETAVKVSCGWSSCSGRRHVDHGQPGPDEQDRLGLGRPLVEPRGPRVSDVALAQDLQVGPPARRRVAEGEHDDVRLDATAVVGHDRVAVRRSADVGDHALGQGQRAPRGDVDVGEGLGEVRAVQLAGQERPRVGRHSASRAPAQQVVGVAGHGAEPAGEVVEGVQRVCRAVGEARADAVVLLDDAEVDGPRSPW